MAFDKDFLTSIGVGAEAAEAILDMHAETVSYYNSLREDAERTRQIQAEIDEIKRCQDEESEWKNRYEAVHAEFSELKKREEVRAHRALREKAYERVLFSVGVPSKLVSLIMRSNPSEVDGVILDGNCLVNEQAIRTQILNEYSDFIERPAVRYKKW